MDNNNMLALEERIVTVLKTVYDPEIPVDVYNLGLIYDVDCGADGAIVITMTLTAPNGTSFPSTKIRPPFAR